MNWLRDNFGARSSLPSKPQCMGHPTGGELTFAHLSLTREKAWRAQSRTLQPWATSRRVSRRSRRRSESFFPAGSENGRRVRQRPVRIVADRRGAQRISATLSRLAKRAKTNYVGFGTSKSSRKQWTGMYTVNSPLVQNPDIGTATASRATRRRMDAKRAGKGARSQCIFPHGVDDSSHPSRNYV